MRVQTRVSDDGKERAVPGCGGSSHHPSGQSAWRALVAARSVPGKGRENAEREGVPTHGAAFGNVLPVRRVAFEKRGETTYRPMRLRTAPWGPEGEVSGRVPESVRKVAVGAAERSASRHAAGRDVVAVPVVDGEGFDANACPWLWAVNEVVLPDVDAGVIAGTRNAEHDDVARPQTAAGNALSDAGLIAADAGNGNAVGGAGPVDEAGAVEAAGGRGAAGNVGAAELTFGCGGYGCSAAGGDAVRLMVVWPVGLFTAACGHEKGHAQKQQRKIPIQGMSAMSRHDGPAGVETCNISFLWYPGKSCKF